MTLQQRIGLIISIQQWHLRIELIDKIQKMLMAAGDKKRKSLAISGFNASYGPNAIHRIPPLVGNHFIPAINTQTTEPGSRAGPSVIR
jgi:hypothetical protein